MIQSAYSTAPADKAGVSKESADRHDENVKTVLNGIVSVLPLRC